jgi:hypothetical protein
MTLQTEEAPTGLVRYLPILSWLSRYRPGGQRHLADSGQ